MRTEAVLGTLLRQWGAIHAKDMICKLADLLLLAELVPNLSKNAQRLPTTSLSGKKKRKETSSSFPCNKRLHRAVRPSDLNNDLTLSVSPQCEMTTGMYWAPRSRPAPQRLISEGTLRPLCQETRICGAMPYRRACSKLSRATLFSQCCINQERRTMKVSSALLGRVSRVAPFAPPHSIHIASF